MRLPFFPLALSLAVLGAADVARPCIPYSCEHPYAAPPQDATAPVNAALAFRPFWSDLDHPAPPPLTIHRVDEAGYFEVAYAAVDDRDLPGVVTVRLALPEPGHYDASFGDFECLDGHPDQLHDRRVRFTLGPEARLPTSAGTLAVGERVLEPVMVDASASCVASVDAATRAISFEPDPELVPWLSVARLTLVVDGEVWATTGYGGARAADADWAPHSVSSVFTVCANDTPDGWDRGLWPGQHRGELRVRLAGEPADLPPVPFEFWIGCGDEPGTGGTGGDGAGGSGGDGGSGGVGGCGAGGFGGFGGDDGGGGNDADPDGPVGPGADVGGCSCRTAGDAGTGALPLLALGLLLRRRRR